MLRKCGFTIIEFFVSIAAILLLAALVLPMIQNPSHARGVHRIQSCGHNLRQIGMAFEAYLLSKGKGRYPLRHRHKVEGIPLSGYSESSELVSGLFYGVSPILESTGNFKCSSDDLASPNQYNRKATAPYDFDIGTTSYLFRPDGYQARSGQGRGQSPMIADRQGNHEGANIYMLDKSVNFYDLDRLFAEFPYKHEGDFYDSPMLDTKGNPILVP